MSKELFLSSKLKQEMEKDNYFATEELVLAIKNAMILEKPILIEGPPGVGKTQLAKTLAKIVNEPLIRLQCTPEINERKALYEFNYSKQLLYIQLLKDKFFQGGADKTVQQMIEHLDKDNPFFSESFLIKRPILQAFLPDNQKQKILLVDEVDKASEDFTYSLLEAFSDYAVSIPELKTIEATVKPFTVITSNRTKKLTDTLKRRCIYVYLSYPTVKEETKIIMSQTNVSKEIAQQVAKVVKEVREQKMLQYPSIAESIEWAKVLTVHLEDKEEIDVEVMTNTVSVIAKNKSDQEKVKEVIGRAG